MSSNSPAALDAAHASDKRWQLSIWWPNQSGTAVRQLFFNSYIVCSTASVSVGLRSNGLSTIGQKMNLTGSAIVLPRRPRNSNCSQILMKWFDVKDPCSQMSSNDFNFLNFKDDIFIMNMNSMILVYRSKPIFGAVISGMNCQVGRR